MRIFDLALKDLSQTFRDKRSVLFLVVMPIVFTFFMGFAYRGNSEAVASDSRIPLGWVDNDPEGLISQRLRDMLSQADSVKLVDLAPEAADNVVRQGEVAGALIVPAGFSQQAQAGNAPQLTLVADLGSAEGQSLYQTLRATITQLMSSAEIASISAETIGNAAEFEQSFVAVADAWTKADSASLVKVEMAIAEPEQAWYGDTPYNQASPGILVMFAIFGLIASGQILLQERKSRTLQRMISTSMQAWQIVAGHTLAMFAMVFIQIALLVIFGQWVLNVNYLHEPLGTLMVSVALSLWVSSMGLLIGLLAKSDDQVVVYSLIAMFVFSALGGVWFPLEVSGGGFAAIGKLTPSAWAMTGYQNILLRGLGLDSAWLPTGIILAYALGFFLLAVWRFRKMEI